MTISVLTNSASACPTLEWLRQERLLHSILAPAAGGDLELLNAWAAQHHIPFLLFEKSGLRKELEHLRGCNKEHLFLSFGFPWKIPQASLVADSTPFYNVHYSLLPSYAGPAPVFWQIRNGEQTGGVTIHQLNGTMDGGPIAAQMALPIFAGETTGLYSSRLAAAATELIRKFVMSINTGRPPNLRLQDEQLRTVQPRPSAADMQINWRQDSARSIEHLVNACNPVGGGAATSFRGQPVFILELSPAEGAPGAPALPPGTIAYADGAQGLFVACRDGKLVRINVVRLREGIFSGQRLVALGFRAGDCFGEGQKAPAPIASTTINPFLHQ